MRQLVIQVPQFWVKMGVKLSFLVRRPTHAFGDYMAVIACVRCTYMTGSGLELLVCSLHGKTLRLQLAVQLTLVAELTDKLCGNCTYVVGITVNYNPNHNLASQIRMFNPCS